MIVNTISKPSGLVPLIVVTAPTGSTVTCDSIVGTESSGTWTFKVAIGSHTIVATQGSSTKTETVVVDAVAVYPITISYMPSGCIAEYLFNDNTNDTSGNGNDLTPSGLTYSSCPLSGINKMCYFAGNSSSNAKGNSQIIPTNNIMSLSIWVNPSDVNNTSNSMVFDSIYGVNPRQGYGIHFYRGELYVICCYGKETVISGFSTNTWYHIVMTKDRYNWKVYVNGALVDEATLTQLVGTGSNFMLGYVYNLSAGINYYYKGYLANARIYDRAITSDEVATLYNNGNGI